MHIHACDLTLLDVDQVPRTLLGEDQVLITAISLLDVDQVLETPNTKHQVLQVPSTKYLV